MAKSDVNFTIGADASAFAGTLQKVQGGLAGLGQAFIGLYGIASGLQTAFAAMMVPIKAFGELENVQTQMGIMLGSAEAAERLTANLQSMATNGVVSMKDLTAAAAALSGTMKDPAMLTEWVGRIADIAAASRISAPQLAGYFALVQSSGEVTTRAVDTVAKQGVPIYEALAKVMQSSTAEVKAALTDGAISVSQYEAALVGLTSAGGAFHEMNASMSGTTLGSIATLQAQWEELLAEFGKPIAMALTPVLNEFTAILKESKPLVERVMAGVGDFLKMMKPDPAMRASWEPLLGAVMQVGDALLTLLVPLYKMQSAFTGIALDVVVSLLDALMPLLEACGDILLALAPLLQLVAVGVGFVAEGLKLLLEGVKYLLIPIKALGVALRGLSEDVQALLGVESASQRAAAAASELADRERRAAAVAEIQARNEERKAAALERSAEASERAAEMEQIFEGHYDDIEKKRLNALKDSEGKKRGLLRYYGVKDEDDLSSQIGSLLAKGDPTKADAGRLKELLALENQLYEIERRIAREKAEAAQKEVEAAEKAAKEREKAYREYQSRRDAERDAAWLKGASLAERREYLFGVGSQQMTPGEVSVGQVRADMDALAAEDAVKYASMIADMEKWLAAVASLEEDERAAADERESRINSARVDMVQSSLASVGGGGGAIRIGDKRFREAQAQTALLKSIDEALHGPQSKKLLAVLA